MIEVVGLNVYPVKSCRGISLREARLAETGIEFDRNWMVVDASGEFLSQREAPALALVEPMLNGGGLKLRAPGMAPIDIPAGVSGAATRVRIWNDQCPAFDEGDIPAQWITQYLGSSARLVRFDPEFRRVSSTAWTGEITALNRFSDGYPILLVSEASINDIGERVGRALPANRFRPNIVIAGVEPYEEDHLDLLSGAGVALKLVKPCSRCQIVNTDQDTAQVGSEPLLTLATYRGNASLVGAVTFGQNAVIAKGVGTTLRVGDRLDASWNF
jgi:hypothetical protein